MNLLTIPFIMGGIPALVKCSSSQSFEMFHVNLEVWLSLFPFLIVFMINVIRMWSRLIEFFLVSGKQGIIYA